MDTMDRIKKLAKQRGWSLQEVAEKANIGKNSIYRWNTKVPSTQSLKKVADALGTTTSYLLDGKAEKKSVDLKDDDVFMTYGGRPVTDEELEMMRRIARGGDDD